MFKPNYQLLTDSYKVSHWKQLRPGTTKIYSYMESRGGMFPEVMFSGLMPKLYLLREFFYYSSIRHAKRTWASHFMSDKIYMIESSG